MNSNAHHSPMEDTTNDQTGAKPPAPRPRARRGFAVMDADRVRAIASLGGKAAHSAGTAHEFTSEKARVAGRKGGLAPHRPRTKKSSAPPPPVPEAESSEEQLEAAGPETERERISDA